MSAVGEEGQRIGDRDEQAAADQREEGPEAAEDRLAALRAPGDLVVDEVRVQRAVGLVGDEVGDEEDRHDDRGRGDRVTKPSTPARRRARGGREDEGQPAAQRRAQPVRPRADRERQPQRDEALAADEQADDDRGIREVLGQDRQVGRDRRDGEASAKVGTPRMASTRSSPRCSERWAVAIQPL
jgi:hypothetical protein